MIIHNTRACRVPGSEMPIWNWNMRQTSPARAPRHARLQVFTWTIGGSALPCEGIGDVPFVAAASVILGEERTGDDHWAAIEPLAGPAQRRIRRRTLHEYDGQMPGVRAGATHHIRCGARGHGGRVPREWSRSTPQWPGTPRRIAHGVR